jgi:hypothetical protein
MRIVIPHVGEQAFTSLSQEIVRLFTVTIYKNHSMETKFCFLLKKILIFFYRNIVFFMPTRCIVMLILKKISYLRNLK